MVGVSSMKISLLQLLALGGCALDSCHAFGGIPVYDPLHIGDHVGDMVNVGIDAATHPVDTITHPLQAGSNMALAAGGGDGLQGETGSCQGSGNGNAWSCAACSARCCGKYANGDEITHHFGECVTNPIADGLAHFRTAPQLCYLPYCAPDCPRTPCSEVTCSWEAGIKRQFTACKSPQVPMWFSDISARPVCLLPPLNLLCPCPLSLPRAPACMLSKNRPLLYSGLRLSCPSLLLPCATGALSIRAWGRGS